MKKILSVILTVALLSVGCAFAEGTLRVGMECNYTPFNWTQAEQGENGVALDGGGYADGYDVRIAQKIAEALDKELVIVKTEWDGLVPSLTSGMIDCIIAGMSPTEDRMATIDFSDSYYESDLVIVVRADSAYANATSLADFSGAKIVGQLNTFHDTVIDQIPDVQHQTPMDTFPTMIVAVTSGAVDGYVSERPGAESAVAANPELTFVSFEGDNGFAYDPSEASIAVGVAKGSELTEQINEILAGISAEERQQIMDDAVAAQPSAE